MIRDLIFGGAGSTTAVPEGWNLSTTTFERSTGLSDYFFDSFVSTKGDYLYLLKYDNNTLYQYSLPNPYSIQSASLIRSKAMTSSTGQGIWFYPDGSFFILQSQGADDLFKYNMSTPWDISTATLVSGSLNASGQASDTSGVYINKTGNYAYIASLTNKAIYQYTLSTPFDLTTGSFTRSLTFGALVTDVWFNNTGTKMYTVGSFSPVYVKEYVLSTAWNISTATLNYTFTVGNISPAGISFNATGTKMYLISDVIGAIYQYSLTS